MEEGIFFLYSEEVQRREENSGTLHSILWGGAENEWLNFLFLAAAVAAGKKGEREVLHSY